MNIKAEGTINIGGAERRVKLGTNATAEFCRLHKIGLNEFGERFATMQLGDVRDLLYCALWSGSGGQVDFTPFEVGDWLDEGDSFEQAIAFFNSIETVQAESKPTKKK
jgi:hypothetical protein